MFNQNARVRNSKELGDGRILGIVSSRNLDPYGVISQQDIFLVIYKLKMLFNTTIRLVGLTGFHCTFISNGNRHAIPHLHLSLFKQIMHALSIYFYLICADIGPGVLNFLPQGRVIGRPGSKIGTGREKSAYHL